MAKKETVKTSWKERLEKLTEQYRLILLKEQTYEERLAINTNILQIIIIALLFTLCVIIIVTLLFMFTPLKNTIPGYVDDQWKRDARYARFQVDSLTQVVKEKERYVNNIKILLEGNVIEGVGDRVTESGSVEDQPELDAYNTTPEDSALRAKVTGEDRYLLSVNQIDESPESASQLYLFLPLAGMVSSNFDPKIDHYGIDIVAPANSLIKAVLDGTVVFASWTSDGGYEVHIQHSYNLLSVYKHNSVLLKRAGDHVEAGDAIAIIGDSGDHSDGPHLHLEIWKNGLAVDPGQFFAFEE